MPDPHDQVDAGQCATCAHARRVRSSRGATFVRWRRAANDAARDRPQDR